MFDPEPAPLTGDAVEQLHKRNRAGSKGRALALAVLFAADHPADGETIERAGALLVELLGAERLAAL